MTFLERFKDFTTGTGLRTVLSSLVIALLIPITLFANTQRWELRRKAAENTGLLSEGGDLLVTVEFPHGLARLSEGGGKSPGHSGDPKREGP